MGLFSVSLLGFLVRPVITEVGGVFFETPPFVVVDNFLVAKLDLLGSVLNSDLPISDLLAFVVVVLVGGFAEDGGGEIRVDF